MRQLSCLLIIPLVAWVVVAHADAGDRRPGVVLRLYDLGRGVRQVPELKRGQLPNVARVIETIDLRPENGGFAPLADNFYSEVEGFVTIAAAGEYTFRLRSDDGARLWIDGRLVIDNDGLHGPDPKDGSIELSAGAHALKIAHFEAGGGEQLTLEWRRKGTQARRHAGTEQKGEATGEGEAPAEPLRAETSNAGFTLVSASALSHDATVSLATAAGPKAIIPPLRRGLPGDGTPLGGSHPSYAEISAPSSVKRGPDLRIESGFLLGVGAQETRIWIPDASREHPSYALNGPYSRHGLIAAGDEIKRVFLETDSTIPQGGVLRFSRRPEKPGVHFRYNGDPAFEMLAVRARTNGFEIEFTKPLDPRVGWEADSYYVEQWPFSVEGTQAGRQEGTEARRHAGTQERRHAGTEARRRAGTEQKSGATAGVRSEPDAQARGSAPQRDGVRYPVRSASVSADRKKVFLEIPNLKTSHVVYIRLLPPCISEDGERPWSSEAWYTLNAIPKDRYAKVLTPPRREPQNILTAEERAAGWKLLFNGTTTAGWHGFKKDRCPDGWQVVDGTLVRVAPAGDIVTDEQFDNFELSLEWRISAGGNSGIIFHVSEDPKYTWVWQTGPEMQVLDNAEHHDGKNPLTSAGSNYALNAPPRDLTKPVGLFNKVRLIVNGSHVEHWMNGEKLLEYELWSAQWKRLVAHSKFNAMPDYGLMKTGRIALQDHGDRVWYRNIKIRRLPAAQ